LKRKKKTSFKSSQQFVQEETCSYLPDDCWEIVFRFLVINDNNRHHYLNSLSLVSKQFLRLTNGLLFSLTVYDQTRPFVVRLFERFTHLNSLDLSHYHCYLNKLLRKISCSPLNITSLNISNNPTIPVNGLRAFSKKVTTLTSLNASDIHSLKSSHLLLIADCFPLLKQLNLGKSLRKSHTNAIHSLLSKCQHLQHLELDRSNFMNDQHVAQLTLFLADLVSINLNGCYMLTEVSFFLLVRNCPSLSEIRMEDTAIGNQSVENNDSLTDIGVYPQLKSLYLANNIWLSDENIIMFASSFPNLEMLDLSLCNDSYFEGIPQVLRRCYKIRHLNLAGCSFVDLFEKNFVVPKLEVLDLSDTDVHDETLYAISKSCPGLLELSLIDCDWFTEKGVKDVVENCKRLRQIVLGGSHISDEIRKLAIDPSFSSVLKLI